MNKDDIKKDAIFGVIGVCGINGNLIARILMDHGYNVQANDMVNKENCKFKKALENYQDMKIYHGNIPEEFFKTSDYMILPSVLIEKKSKLYQKVIKYQIPLLKVEDICDLFEPTHPVICITGTNGKTTTTSMLKHIVYELGLKPCEHNLTNMQGNIADIPPLQSRLNGDVNILETGTFGHKGDLLKLASRCKPDCAILTNITPDHLSDGNDFLDYAHVKGELVSLVKNKTLIVNSDDPTIMGLLDELNYEGNLITFGLDVKPVAQDTKPCFCGEDILINRFISGMGNYNCDCGISYKKPEYIATNINSSHDEFTLKTPEGVYDFKLSVNGLHNIYNATGAIIAAHIMLNIPYSDIITTINTFTGVNGRMEKIGNIHGKQIMIDYAHNPAGIITVLSELKNYYNTIINVITTSSESGLIGDKEILESASEYADYIVPASHNAYICAKQAWDKGLYKNKLVLPKSLPKNFKEGTLGATKEQVIAGFKLALTIDADLLVCTGEAAFKYKNDIIKNEK